MDRRRRSHLSGTVLLLVACDQENCTTTDPPEPLPNRAHALETPYDTDGGAFTVVLHAGGDSWPPSTGITTLFIEASAKTASPGPGPAIDADPPHHFERDLAAEHPPSLERVDDTTWRADAVELSTAGLWVLPLRLEDDTVSDTIDVKIRAAE